MNQHSNPLATKLADIDRCVMCGLCLPHCPTYNLYENEAESPRGRLALMGAVARGALELDAKGRRHLEQCLACRACEAACPSGVPYGAILDSARQALRQENTDLVAANILSSPSKIRWLMRALWLGQRTGMDRMSGVLRIAQKISGAHTKFEPPKIATFPRALPRRIAPVGAKRGTVALFAGCLGDNLNRGVATAAIRLLSHAGFEVHVPAAQRCCGALFQHYGHPEKTAALRAANIAAFNALGKLDAIVGIATGCLPSLTETANDDSPSATWPAPIVDVVQFLDDRLPPGDSLFLPLPNTIAVHTPCSQRFPLRGVGTSERLLRRIPRADIVNLDQTARHCCGAAGSHVFSHPKQAAALRAPLIAAIRESGAAYLATGNVGCGMHLEAGLREEGTALKTVHPVELLAMQLR